MNDEVRYIALLVSEGYTWVGYGNTVEAAKECIRKTWEMEFEDSETTVTDLEEMYHFYVNECNGRGLCLPI